MLYHWLLLLNPLCFGETQYWARGSEAQRAKLAARQISRAPSGQVHNPGVYPPKQKNGVDLPGFYRIFLQIQVFIKFLT